MALPQSRRAGCCTGLILIPGSMWFDPRIHSASLLAKDLLGRAEKLRGGLRYNNNELIVVNYHSTPKKFIPQFLKQAEFLASHFHVIKPGELADYYEGRLHTGTCALLFTFDDGLKNNLYAAEKLEQVGLRAFFFLVPGFIETAAEEQKNFYLKNIRPVVNPRIDSREEDFTAMNWEELKALSARGHGLGAHTFTHTLVAQQSTEQNAHKEIVDCKPRLEEKLGVPIDSFCSINNTLLSTGAREKKLIEKNYSFHFTTLPGLNAPDKNKLFIKRRNVECFWPDGAFYYALGQSDLSRWKEKTDLYNKL
jgi:peptidoglycan/xylan/chitin deacetylase (PgdA/CDA1 family)